MSDIEERFGAALQNCARGWRKAVECRLKSFNMTQASLFALAIAAQAKSPLSQTEMAERLEVECPTVVAMVDRLVKRGLVVRVPASDDRRVKRVILTKAGRLLVEKLQAEVLDLRNELLADTDPSALLVAIEVLNSLRESLETQCMGPGENNP